MQQNIYRTIMPLLLWVWMVALWAQAPQANFALDNNQSGNKLYYVARDYVTLKPGFIYKADGINNFKALIDQTLVFKPTNNIYAQSNGTIVTDPKQGGIVGTIPGQLSVGATGSAVYTIPIECPAGVKDMKPDLSLVYNSQGGDGPLGMGWSISGLSCITRTAPNIFQDEAVSGFDYSGDRYLLDGMRLINSTGEFYDTETKSYKQISKNWAWNNQSFVVKGKDGKIYTYGYSDDSRVLLGGSGSSDFQWLLNSVHNDEGQFITYGYLVAEQGHQTVIKNIDYAFDYDTGAKVQILFNYVNKDCAYVSHIGSRFVIDRLLLKNIQIISNPYTECCKKVLRQYDLEYNYDGNRYTLKSVQLVGQNNERYNATTIEWGDNNKTKSVQSVALPTVTSANTNDFCFQKSNSDALQLVQNWAPDFHYTDYSYNSADIDGDGISDLIEYYSLGKIDWGAPFLNIYKGGVKDGNVSFSSRLLSEVYYGVMTTQDYSPLQTGFKFGDPFVSDLNADGKKTIITPCYLPGKVVFHNALMNTAISVNEPVVQTLKVSSELTAYATGDINNDGLDEIVSLEKSANCKGEIMYIKKGRLESDFLYTDKSSNQGYDEVFHDQISISPGDKPQRIFIVDFDSDGLKDMMIMTSTGYAFYKNNGGTKGTDGITHVSFSYVNNSENWGDSYVIVKPGDFNGDGLIDFLVNEKETFNWEIGINDGNWGFVFHSIDLSSTYEDFTNKDKDKSDFIITDYNHDGKSDIIVVDAVYVDASHWYENRYGRYDHTDIKWYSMKYDLSLVLDTAFTVRNEGYTFNKYNTSGDFDGDGREDILTFGSDLLHGNRQSDSVYVYSALNKNFEANLVKSITNGLGVKSSISYQPLTYDVTSDGKKFYTKGGASSYPVADIQAPIYCVKTISQPNGKGGISKVDYAYSGARAQLTGKGFLGFQSQTVLNNETNQKSVTTTYLHPAYYMPDSVVIKQFTLDSIPELLSEEKSYFNNSKSGYFYLSNLTKSYQANYLSDLISVKEVLSYDNYGNPTKVKQTNGNISVTDSISYGQFGSISPYPNKPVCLIKTTNDGIGSSSRKTTYEYDQTKGYLTKETTDPNDVNKVTKEYSNFDRYGRPQLASITANGKTRTTSNSYLQEGDNFYDAPTHIFSATNVLGEGTSYSFKPGIDSLGYDILGLVYTKTDRIGRTDFEYNGLGQLVQTNRPDGTKKVEMLLWAGSNIFGAKYYLHSEESGKALVTIYYDELGREIVKETTGLKGNKVRVFTEYNANGSVYRVSEPTFGTVADKWASVYSYDKYGRKETVSTPMGTTTIAYDGRKTTITSPDGTKVTQLNTAGQISYTKVNDKCVTYAYYPSGLTRTATPEGGQSITMEYNLQGNRTKLVDPDAGTVLTKFNGFGELVQEKQAVKNSRDTVTTIHNYADNGLLQTIVRNGDTTRYAYDSSHRIDSIEITGKHVQKFTYDAFDRVTKYRENIMGKTYVRQTEYDKFGREAKATFPSGYYTTNTFDRYGNLTEVKDNANHTIWQAMEENERGQITKAALGSRAINYKYNSRGFPASISAPGIFNTSYLFSDKGNLSSRTDLLTKQKDSLEYDVLNRLKSWAIYKNGSFVNKNTITYDPTTGNIAQKSDLGTFTMGYGENSHGPHALTSISGVPTNFPSGLSDSLIVGYTDFKKISSLKEGNKYYTLSYGVDDQRRRTVYSIGGTEKMTRYYFGDYEEEISSGNVRRIHYISGGDGLAAILIQNKGVDSLLYAYTDYQGSLMALTDANGKVVERFVYDPWGMRRDTLDWSKKDSRTNWLVNRGYTGHEHLDAFGIINMNGRVYDPLTAMFFSPDPYVQAPDNWLNYNRYGYGYGNPFKYTDPSGEIFVLDDIIAAAFFGVLINTTMQGMSGKINSLGDYCKAAFIGGISGIAGAAGGAFAGAACKIGGFWGGAAVGASGGFAGGFVGGASNVWMNGGSFGDGLQAGFVGGLIGGAAGGLIGGVAEGLDATRHGGTFWDGVGRTDDFLVGNLPQNSNTSSEKVAYNNESAQKFSDNRFGKSIKGLRNLHADNTVPEGYAMTGSGRVYNSNMEEVCGTTKYIGKGQSDVYLYKKAFDDSKVLHLTMGHEYVHVGQNYAGLNFFGSKPFKEYAAYSYTNMQSSLFGLQGITINQFTDPIYYLPDFAFSRFVKLYIP